MTTQSHREIPYNYTSADDRQAVTSLLGKGVWKKLEELRERRITGRSARLLMRIFGEVLVLRRNPYLRQELVTSSRRRKRFFGEAEATLRLIQDGAGNDAIVLEVLAEARRMLDGVRDEVRHMPDLQARIRRALGAVVGRDNVLLDPFTLTAHATDATDWRLHLPLAVVTPTEESQVAPLLVAIRDLGLHAIPRGAGTGLTGGAIPLTPDCVMVNTEKLNHIRGVSTRPFVVDDGRTVEGQVLDVEAGVITESAMEYATHRGLVFATDPTSAWACTIGGNIAENAGGKDCVLWGTCIDNIVSFRIAMPGGHDWTVRRVNHPLRKILFDDRVRFEVRDATGGLVRSIELLGSEIRKKGLWKDITNKALGGLPGVQKEGTDGVITSAEFVLYPAYPHQRTLCLEFFGPDFDEASEVILEIAREMPNKGEEALSALEHFDDQYVKAIGYQVKAPRAETPKAVIIVDVVGHSAEQVERGLAKIRSILSPHANTFLAVARDAAEGKKFWADRKKLGAIARRTNAFKINEDVVLPLSELAEFSLFIDAMNVHEERHCQDNFVRRAETYLRGVPSPEDALWPAKLEAALAACVRARSALEGASEAEVRSLAPTDRLRQDLAALLGSYPKVAATLGSVWDEVRARLIVLATHMHAGDGNVHVNIPVLSNDRQMLRRADAVVEKVFDRVHELGGVVSGEHGIGVTKLKYWDPERRKELEAYRRSVDPGGLMNPGKLSDLAVLDHVYTPSFNLLKLEARILQHGQLEELAKRIATCVRCGKCKPDCCVFYPARGMFFHPRNKNLAIGALIEALLYDAQRERSGSFELLRHLEEVADHCTICHKCLKPCPVDIDTGEVTVIEREILAARGFKQMPVATRLTLRYLDTRSRLGNKLFRTGLVRIGGAAQRAGYEVTRPLQKLDGNSRLLATLRSPVWPADEGTLRDVVPECRADQALLFEPDEEAKGTVFYFPGCGSERLFSRISQASIHVLLEAGLRVVLPPPFLCCGFPAHANALTEQHGRTVLRDTILFSQIRDMFSHLEFDAVGVSCGTCMDGLEGMEVEKIFGAPVKDVMALALDRGLALPPADAKALYHTPCHDSLRGTGVATLRRAGLESAEVPNCCSEAGTLALSRPDITDSMLHRKAAAVREAMEGRPAGTVMITNCPSCVQGLGRNAALGVTPRHLTVDAAMRLSGDAWPELFRQRAQRAKVIQL